jgi:hypothetical protein
MAELMGELSWKVVKYLNLAPSSTEAVNRSLTILEESSTYPVQEIREILAKLEGLEATLAEESENVNFALVKADVLGYDQKMRVAGILLSQSGLIQRLGKIVGVAPDLSVTNQFLRALSVPYNRQIQGTIARN